MPELVGWVITADLVVFFRVFSVSPCLRGEPRVKSRPKAGRRFAVIHFGPGDEFSSFGGLPGRRRPIDEQFLGSSRQICTKSLLESRVSGDRTRKCRNGKGPGTGMGPKKSRKTDLTRLGSPVRLSRRREERARVMLSLLHGEGRQAEASLDVG